MSAKPLRFVQLPNVKIIGHGWIHERRAFDVYVGDAHVGSVIEIRYNAWAARMPDGSQTMFTLPSRKQAGEWLAEASNA